LLLIGCSTEQTIAPYSYYDFGSLKEKSETEYKARHGDATAARRMAEYSYFIEKSRVKAVYWYKVGASYGDKLSKENARKLSEP
jgi:hypothetical protein